jgi:UDP-glucose 4-epimerase
VLVLDNLLTGNRENIADIESQLRFINGDIRDREGMQTLLQGVDYVFHQAALASVPWSVRDSWLNNDINVNGTLSVLEAARAARVRRVIYAASSAIYGDSELLPKVEGMPPQPLSPYAIAKYVGELYCQVFHSVYGLEAVALRYFNVFGPRQDPKSEYAAVIPKFITAMLQGSAPTIFGDGEQTRDFTYIDNVVDANVKAAMAPSSAVAGRVFNIGCGDRVSLNTLVRELNVILGSSMRPVYAEGKIGDVRDSMADISCARMAFDYAPRATLAEGLAKTVEWYRGSR